MGIGGAFTQAGPLSVLLGYSFTGVAVFAMMQCLGEMATWLPLPGSIPQFCARYADDALGFAVGWNVSFSSLPISAAVPPSQRTLELRKRELEFLGAIAPFADSAFSNRTGITLQSLSVPKSLPPLSSFNIGQAHNTSRLRRGLLSSSLSSSA